MNLLMMGVNFRTTPVQVREKLALGGDTLTQALEAIQRAFNCESVILSTCNRVEMYFARLDGTPLPAVGEMAELLGRLVELEGGSLADSLQSVEGENAVRHLFRVVSSLDSLVLGEGQIAGQVKQAYEVARQAGASGPALNGLFQWARQVARRVRTETGLAQGHVSVSSVAVDYVREVFDHFGDKTIAVLGAGKMAELTLRQLTELKPKRVIVTNRSFERAESLARAHGGLAVPWTDLDSVLARADIVLSTTGSPEPIVTLDRWRQISRQRKKGRCVVLDIAVPRDFDPRIHDGDAVCLFNIDDLNSVRNATLEERRSHIPAADQIVEQEAARFLRDWTRRKHGNAIAKLTREFESKRETIVSKLLQKLNGRLSPEDKRYIEGAFRLLQNQYLHGPIAALAEESANGVVQENHTLLDALRKLFRLPEADA